MASAGRLGLLRVVLVVIGLVFIFWVYPLMVTPRGTDAATSTA